MNFSVYVSKSIAQALQKYSKELMITRNSIFREALEMWIGQHQKSQWPKGFFDFKPVEDVPDFKKHRKRLKKPLKDPLA